LLRARRERQHYRRAAEQRDELAPFYSITSSARASAGPARIGFLRASVPPDRTNAGLVRTEPTREAAMSAFALAFRRRTRWPGKAAH
jgi:hypothetical protein